MVKRTLCIVTPASDPVFVAHKSFVQICDNNFCAAVVLSQMMYWHEVKTAHKTQAKATNDQMVTVGEKPTQNTDFWVWKSVAELHNEFFGCFGTSSIRDAIKLLLTKRFLAERNNPINKWDRRKQYLFQVENVQTAINAHSLDSTNANDENGKTEEESDDSIGQNQSIHSLDSINAFAFGNESIDQNQRFSIEITSEDTNKNTTTDYADTPAKLDSLPVEVDNALVVVADKFGHLEEENPLVEKLIKVGVSEAKSRQLVRDHPDRIDAQIAYLPHREITRSKSGTLIASIEGNWSVPVGYHPPTPVRRPKIHRADGPVLSRFDFNGKRGLFDRDDPTPTAPMPTPTTKVKTANQRAEEAWSNLSTDEQQDIEKQAQDYVREFLKIESAETSVGVRIAIHNKCLSILAARIESNVAV